MQSRLCPSCVIRGSLYRSRMTYCVRTGTSSCLRSILAAPLVRPGRPRRHTRPSKRVQHRPTRHAKMLPDISKGLTALVQDASHVDVRVREHPIPNLATRAPNDVRHRPTIDAELDSERIRRLPRLVTLGG